jgi:hypothetical protein
MHIWPTDVQQNIWIFLFFSSPLLSPLKHLTYFGVKIGLGVGYHQEPQAAPISQLSPGRACPRLKKATLKVW